MNIIDYLFNRLGAGVKRDSKIGFLGDRLPDEEDNCLETILDNLESDPPNFVEIPKKKLNIIIMGKERK